MRYLPLLVGLLIAFPAFSQPIGGLVRVNHLAENIAPPFLTNVTTAGMTLFSTNASRTAGRVLIRTVQNVGMVPVLYVINATTNSVATNYFHGIISGGVTNLDGLGSILDLSKVPFPVTFATASSSSVVSVVELTQ